MGLKVYVVVKPPQSNAIHLMKQTIAQILTQKIQKYNDKYISQCNPPDETVHSTNTNTNSDKNTRTNTKKPSQLAF